MSSAGYYNSQSLSYEKADTRTVTGFQRALLFLLGALLPVISLSPTRSLSSQLVDRVMLVDIVCIVVVVMLASTRRLKVGPALWFYFFTLLLALGIGLSKPAKTHALTEGAALMMAAVYCVVGASIVNSPRLIRPLILGMILGVFAESIIVLHDFFLPNWFEDRLEGRVRGTFKASGQLGQYGFAMAGVLFSFGWTYFRSKKARNLCLLAGGLSLFFVIAASRRSGMLALIAWLGIFLLLGWRQVQRKTYFQVMGVSFIAGILLLIYASALSASFSGVRFLEAWQGVVEGNTFAHQQFYIALDELSQWFPFGVGIGQGLYLMESSASLHARDATSTEIHNGHLALIVETGILGLAAFYLLCMRPLLRRWKGSFGPLTGTVKITLISFVLASLLFMIHNRLHRDRVYMLFLGLAPALVAASVYESSAKQPVVLVRRRRKPNS